MLNYLIILTFFDRITTWRHLKNSQIRLSCSLLMLWISGMRNIMLKSMTMYMWILVSIFMNTATHFFLGMLYVNSENLIKNLERTSCWMFLCFVNVCLNCLSLSFLHLRFLGSYPCYSFGQTSCLYWVYEIWRRFLWTVSLA